MISEKAERAALLNRIRAQKHREKNKRLRLDSSFGPDEQSGPSSGQDLNASSKIYPKSSPTHQVIQQESSYRTKMCTRILRAQRVTPHNSQVQLVAFLCPTVIINTVMIKMLLKSQLLNVRILKMLPTDLQLSHKIKKFNVCGPLDTSEYVYSGVAIHSQKIVNIDLHIENILWLLIHVDGMTPYKSSPMNFWPILGLILHQSASYKPFVIGAYYGRGKPSSVYLYLDDVIAELNHLCKERTFIKGRHFEIEIKCFCCDKPARSFLKCVVNHGAYYACDRCWVIGFYYSNRVLYLLRECQQGTDESVRNRDNPEHHDETLLSPLLELKDEEDKPLDLTKFFIQ
ncbi:hypothetical protein QAD02_007894 [Eretmocerus hayati]|uniref:Uncharacterized protein n=1 Tax=Eretmocerus hayati TaxID=131215 RepID=A0ACC2N581_9HYME|nr:hypothetical protein QAD02_007894 [Eretmocerus hayati]